MNEVLKSHYYNYYNVKGRYTPATKQTAAWVKQFEEVTDRVESNNGNTDSERYYAWT